MFKTYYITWVRIAAVILAVTVTGCVEKERERVGEDAGYVPYVLPDMGFEVTPEPDTCQTSGEAVGIAGVAMTEECEPMGFTSVCLAPYGPPHFETCQTTNERGEFHFARTDFGDGRWYEASYHAAMRFILKVYVVDDHNYLRKRGEVYVELMYGMSDRVTLIVECFPSCDRI